MAVTARVTQQSTAAQPLERLRIASRDKMGLTFQNAIITMKRLKTWLGPRVSGAVRRSRKAEE